MKDEEMSVDNLCAKIIDRGNEIEELQEKNSRYLELIKWLVLLSNGKWVNINKVRDWVDKNDYDIQKAEEAMLEVVEMLCGETCMCGKEADTDNECELCGCLMCKFCVKSFNQSVSIGRTIPKPICIQCFDMIEIEKELMR